MTRVERIIFAIGCLLLAIFGCTAQSLTAPSIIGRDSVIHLHPKPLP